VFQDQPWSAQDERQIRGRAHRQPQRKEVLLYHLLANDTADVVLSGMARSKHDMLEAFLSKESNQGRWIQKYCVYDPIKFILEMCALLSGKALSNPEDDEGSDSDDEPSSKGKAKRKRQTKDKKPRKANMPALPNEDVAALNVPSNIG
jgi:hypothetical protein